MLDINFVRNNPDIVRQALVNRQKDPRLLDQVLKIDQEHRPLQVKVEELRSQQNAINRTIKGKPTPEQVETAGKLKAEIKKL